MSCLRLLVPCAALLGLTAAPAAAETTHIEIRPVVAAPDGQPVVDRAWLVARIERANAIFAPYDLQFVLGPSETFAAPVEALVRADRNALAREVAGEVINLFVVRKLMDVDEPGRIRRGVHWKAHHRSKRVHYVILASYAEEGVLAHELAHFFGNPKHRHEPGNLVGYIPGPGLPRLDPDQEKRLRRALRRMVNSGELVPRGRDLDGTGRRRNGRVRPRRRYTGRHHFRRSYSVERSSISERVHRAGAAGAGRGRGAAPRGRAREPGGGAAGAD